MTDRKASRYDAGQMASALARELQASGEARRKAEAKLLRVVQFQQRYVQGWAFLMLELSKIDDAGTVAAKRRPRKPRKS